MNLIVFKLILIAGGLVAARVYVSRGRALALDRLIVLGLVASLIVAVLYPNITQDAASFLGIGRGTDLVFYFGFILIFVVLAAQRVRLHDQQRTLTVLARTIALRDARSAPQTQPPLARGEVPLS